MSSDRLADGDVGGGSRWYCCGDGWEARWSCYFFFFFLVQRQQPLAFFPFLVCLCSILCHYLCFIPLAPVSSFWFVLLRFLSSLSPLFAPVFRYFFLFLFFRFLPSSFFYLPSVSHMYSPILLLSAFFLTAPHFLSCSLPYALPLCVFLRLFFSPLFRSVPPVFLSAPQFSFFFLFSSLLSPLPPLFVGFLWLL